MLERKGLGIRIGAYAIDVAAMILLSLVLTPVALFVPVVGFLILLAAGLAYPMIEVLQGRSPGKMILGLTITSEDGSPVTRDQLILRTAIKFAPSIIGIVVSSLNILLGSLILSTLGGVAQLGVGITLLVLSLQTLQTTRLAFWDIKAKTAVMGPVATVAPAGFPVQPIQQPVQQTVPPVPSQQ